MAVKHWICPGCNTKICFEGELNKLFDKDDGEAIFDVESGVPFYKIKCPNCDYSWNFGISPMYKD